MPGETLTAHVGLNNRGQIAGAYAVDGPTLRGFVRSRTGYTTFDAARGAPDVLTAPFKINDRGTIAGFYAVGSIDDPESGAFHGFLRAPNGAVAPVDVTGALSTSVFGLNNRGAVVGSFVDADRKEHGFRLNARGRLGASGRSTRRGAADVPDYATTAPFGINNRGQVVGQYVDADGVLHGYLWKRRRGFETIDPPRGAGTVAADIDDRGHILLPAPGGLFKGRAVSVGG